MQEGKKKMHHTEPENEGGPHLMVCERCYRQVICMTQEGRRNYYHGIKNTYQKPRHRIRITHDGTGGREGLYKNRISKNMGNLGTTVMKMMELSST